MPTLKRIGKDAVIRHPMAGFNTQVRGTFASLSPSAQQEGCVAHRRRKGITVEQTALAPKVRA